jgi:hypothetical protein
MKKLALTFALACVFACTAFAQVAADSQASSSASGNASATAGQNSASLASGTTMGATLNKSVDARHAKVGDQVTAKTTEAVKSDGKVVIPKGSTLVGHVTEATARAKGRSPSSLGIAFDRAILKGGHEMPLHAGIQALAASSAVASASASEMETDAMASGGGSAYGRSSASRPGMVGGVGSTAGATAGTVTNTAAGVPGSATSAVGSTAGSVGNTAGSAAGSARLTSHLTASSTGVIGMPGLALTQSSTAAQSSVITSSTQNVHLDSGTQIVLRVNSQ